MGSLNDDEECRFFDAQDTIGPGFDPVSEPVSSFVVDKLVSNGFQYDVWSKAPKSVNHRKNRFLRLMGLSSDDQILDDNAVKDDGFIEEINDRIMQTSRAVLRSPIKEEEEDLSIRSSDSGWREDASCSSSGTECKEEENGVKLLTPQITEPSPLAQKSVNRQIKVADSMARTVNRMKGQFLCRLQSMAGIVHRQRMCYSFGPDDVLSRRWAKAKRVQVRQNKKRSKELSAVFIGQDIQAHQGSILTMKFSPDGGYLASAGEDAVVRVWQVVEDERSNDIDIPDIDPSCIYFTVNHLSELAPLMAEKQKISLLKSLRKTSDSACVIFPPKVFRILEKPVHEFHGHTGDVLDLSWSKDNRLLSSSVDQTVRLWRLGSDRCLKVFPHSNYVTCVQFEPVDEKYFISGSIDGKVRVWSVSSCQVVDWIDVREIVTAVAYSPDGKGGVIGSMTGCCSFFSLSDNHFQLEASVSLNSKKKSPCKRIIGFQFCPQDSKKVMVTSADSHVRILHGINVISKYKGQRNAGNSLCASFTSDGKHIVSACEDSNVYIWDCHNQKESSFYQQKTVRSFECFSADASVALPWSGLKAHTNSLSFSSPCDFSLGQEYFLESITKGSATWPEEKLPNSSGSSPLCKSQYKFFKSSCQSSSSSHKWGLVIMTAGWDGRIRSFLNYGLPATV